MLSALKSFSFAVSHQHLFSLLQSRLQAMHLDILYHLKWMQTDLQSTATALLHLLIWEKPTVFESGTWRPAFPKYEYPFDVLQYAPK